MTTVTRMEDGRRKRGDQSRRQIVDAMLALVREGDMSPSAAQVAERANVGLRTVFRHFEEMEVLYREMADAIAEKLLPVIKRPYASAAWRDKLFEMIDRRIDIHEEIMPLKIAGSILRFRSKFLMEDYRNHLRMERKGLDALLPDNVRKDQTLVRALEMVTSFQAWRRLRQDQDLSVEDARKVMVRLIDGILGTLK